MPTALRTLQPGQPIVVPEGQLKVEYTLDTKGSRASVVAVTAAGLPIPQGEVVRGRNVVTLQHLSTDTIIQIVSANGQPLPPDAGVYLKVISQNMQIDLRGKVELGGVSATDVLLVAPTAAGLAVSLAGTGVPLSALGRSARQAATSALATNQVQSVAAVLVILDDSASMRAQRPEITAVLEVLEGILSVVAVNQPVALAVIGQPGKTLIAESAQLVAAYQELPGTRPASTGADYTDPKLAKFATAANAVAWVIITDGVPGQIAKIEQEALRRATVSAAATTSVILLMPKDVAQFEPTTVLPITTLPALPAATHGELAQVLGTDQLELREFVRDILTGILNQRDVS